MLHAVLKFLGTQSKSSSLTRVKGKGASNLGSLFSNAWKKGIEEPAVSFYVLFKVYEFSNIMFDISHFHSYILFQVSSSFKEEKRHN